MTGNSAEKLDRTYAELTAKINYLEQNVSEKVKNATKNIKDLDEKYYFLQK